MYTVEVLKNIKWRLCDLYHNRYYHYSEEQFARDLKKWFKKNLGRELNLENPKTFNEKIQWLKLYDSTAQKARLADKLVCREFVKDKIGEQYLIPLIGDGGYGSFDEIDFTKLPDKFVLKTNHGCSTNIIVKDKSNLNIREARMKMNRWMASNYGFNQGFELHYGMIAPRIICEKYMGDSPNDYKIFCFNGNPEFVWVDIARSTSHCRNTYDLEWNELPFIINKLKRMSVKRPENLDLMIQLARKLSEDFSFVRVDFYEIEGKVYFGEMTFTSSSGRSKFYPDKYDYIYGNKIVLPERKKVPIKEIKKIWNK